MWYQPTEIAAPQSEPLSVADAKAHLRVFHDDDNDYIGALIVAVREHCEKYCNAFWAERALSLNCDAFCDFGRLPSHNISDVTTIDYVDTNGDVQTLSADNYEFQADASRIVLAYGKSWPTVRAGSRISIGVEAGGHVPSPVLHAIKLKIAELYEHRESPQEADFTAFDSLLSNFRYY